MNHTVNISRLIAITAIVLLVSACATYDHASELETGPGADFDPKKIDQYRKDQDVVLDQLFKLAAVPGAAASAPYAAIAASAPASSVPVSATTALDWDAVIAAGMDYADSKCEAYMHALFRLNRDKRTVVSEIGLVGTATAGLMAAAKAAASDVAAAAIAFGLASSTVDNLSSNLLYELDPSSVRALVKSLHDGYRDALQSGYKNRPAAMTVIRKYAVLCVPASIEAEVNLSVKNASPTTQGGDPNKNQPPSATNATKATAAASQPS